MYYVLCDCMCKYLFAKYKCCNGKSFQVCTISIVTLLYYGPRIYLVVVVILYRILVIFF